MTKIHLLRNLVAIAPYGQRQTGKIVTLDKYHRQQIWKVVEVGPGKRTKKGVIVPIDLKPGDLVVTPEIFNNRDTFTDGVQIVDADELLGKVSNVPDQPPRNCDEQ